MKRITIIGGGASGTLLAVNLIRNVGDHPLELTVIERKASFGRGVAYGTNLSSHLLNVPAGRMGAFPDDVGDFHRWLTDCGYGFDDHAFVPRMIFGEYIRNTFDVAAIEAPSNLNIRCIDDEAVAVAANDMGACVSLKSGETIVADSVVLAFGNFEPPNPGVPDLAFASVPKYFRNPWRFGLYESISPDDAIFVIGTGLSMVDLAMHFHRHGHRGKISAISTRGMLPTVHELGHNYPSFYEEIRDMRRITDLLKAVRRHIEIAESSGSNWRAVIDSLRPVTQQIWLDLPTAEKKYFMQHLSRYWNVARHRMPPEAAAVVDEMRHKNMLEILKGRLKNISFDTADNRFAISFAAGAVANTVEADVLVNCIGSESNLTKVESELIRNLISAGLLRVDPVSLGLDSTPDGRVIDADGKPSNRILTLGTPLKGILWETTAIPEIRTQARVLALKLLEN